MSIDNITIGEARMIANMFGAAVDNHPPFEVGKAYFIRTCTYHFTGRIREITGGFLVLDDAAWIADSGRFADALKAGTLNEVEPMPDGTLVAIGAITDAAPWAHALPTNQK